jgi:tetratricopeptide (TPR) repeat protein
VVEDFVDAMDLPVAPSSTGYRENVAFTAQMIDFLRAFNVRVPRFTGNAENLDRGNIVAALSECDLPGDRLLFDTAQMSAFYERFRKGNDQVAARFFGRPNGLFAEADRAKPRLDAPASYSHEQLMDLIGQLWVFKHRELGQALCREAELKREVQDERTRAAQRQHELVELELVSRLTLLSELALERQQFEKSKAYALDVLALTDDPGRIHYLLANAFNGLGDRARAITHCEQAIALASDRPDYHRFREML